MANCQDARPFVDLQKDAEEFVAKFEEDIAEFKTVLDSKITSLICDPDSFGNPGSYEKNPLIEFSKAKYAIFISMKSLVNDREKEWIKYLAEMKKLFLENVEIFLAGTKLEVKLPASESQSIPAPQKSPGNRKSSLVPSSLYPIISNFTKNIPALSSSLQSKESHSSEREETKTMVSPRNRSLFYQGTDKMEVDEAEMDLNTSRSSSRSRRSAKLNTSDLNSSLTPSREKGKSKETNELNSHVLLNEGMDSEEMVIVEPKISKLQGRGNKIRSAVQNKKSNVKGVQVSSSDSQVEDEMESEKKPSELLRSRGRRGKIPAVDENTGKNTTSEESEETSKVDQRPSRIKSRKSVRETFRSNKTAVSKMSGQSSSDDNEKLQETEINSNIPPVKGRRGKQALKSNEKENAAIKMSDQTSSEDNEKLNELEILNSNIQAVRGHRRKQESKTEEKENALTKSSDQNSSEDGEILREIEININIPKVRGQKGKQSKSEKKGNAVSKIIGNSLCENIEKSREKETSINIQAVKGRRGKKASKNKEKENAVTKMSEQSSSEENEKLREAEINTNIPTVRGRRGKPAASKDKEKENVFKPENQVDEAVYEEVLNAPSDIPATRKGRSAAVKSVVKPSDPPLVSNTRRGRSTTKEEGKATRVSRKPAGRKTLNERISESDTSVSPVRVILPVEEDIDDDLDVYTPVARPTKSSARRKTLLPNMDEPAPGAADTVKGNSTRAKSKRKTISGVSDLASVAPSKRLKISSSQMSNAIIEDDGAVGDDNLLGKNDSYSDWIPLKNVDGKIPTIPAIYEVKVWRAKKTAYIGSCDSLRQMLTLHKLKQNSGHKHLDKFIERNYDDIQVRYEVVASLNDAKAEVKNRINNFVAQHKTTPAYN